MNQLFFLAIVSAYVAPVLAVSWSEGFSANQVAEPTEDCFVCFYERLSFQGDKFCVGRRNSSSTEINPIQTQPSISSIKFGTGCDLVVNARVFDSPYDEHVDLISEDIANYSGSSVNQAYVEEAGRACLSGSRTLSLGNCYTEDTASLGPTYDKAFGELLLFKSTTKDFDVVLYENEDFNHGNATARSHEFSSYSKDLSYTNSTGEKEWFRVSSIAFVSTGGGESTPATVAPCAG